MVRFTILAVVALTPAPVFGHPPPPDGIDDYELRPYKRTLDAASIVERLAQLRREQLFPWPILAAVTKVVEDQIWIYPWALESVWLAVGAAPQDPS